MFLFLQCFAKYSLLLLESVPHQLVVGLNEGYQIDRASICLPEL